MKKHMIRGILALACAALLVCGAFAENAGITIEKTSVVLIGHESTVTDYYYDDIILHESGLYEIIGRAVTGETEEKVRWLYTDGGIPLVTRQYENGYFSDTVSGFYYLDRSFDSYVENLADVERVVENIIFFADGSHEVVTVQDGVISQTARYNADGSVTCITQNALGMMEQYSHYDAEPADEIADMQIIISYTTIKPGELIG